MKAKVLSSLQAALIAAVACWVFSPAMHGDWLWDDTIEVAGNSVLRDPAGLWKIWFAPDGADYFPLKSTVQWVEWRFWGDNVAGYHWTSLGLHLLSAFLFWNLLRRLGVRQAWVGGLLFAVHPLAVESVAWISELKNTLSLPLLLLAMRSYLDYDEHNRRRDHVLSVFWFGAAMLAKTSVVMFPVILLLYAGWKRGRVRWSDVRASAPFFAVSLVLGLVTIWFQLFRPVDGVKIVLGGFFSRLAAAGTALAFYSAKFVVPVRLSFIYAPWAAVPFSLWPFLPWLALGAGCAWLWKKRSTWGRHALFGLGWFVVNLVPVLGFVPMAYLRFAPVADHFVYVPLLGLIGLAAAAFSALVERGIERAPPDRSVPVLSWSLLAILCAILAVESRRYSALFRSAESLWTDTLLRNPTAWLAHNNLGLILATSGRLPEAIGHFETALKLNPGYAEACNNLGLALFSSGRAPEAAACYERALQLRPSYPEAQNNLGSALLQIGRTSEALTHIERALCLNPDYAEAHNNRAAALAATGRPEEAIAEYEQVLRLRPADPEAHYNLGTALASADELPRAIGQYEAALRLNPNHAGAHANLGAALASVGRLEESAGQFQQALLLEPNAAKIHYSLGLVLRALGRIREAEEQFAQARQLEAK